MVVRILVWAQWILSKIHVLGIFDKIHYSIAGGSFEPLQAINLVLPGALPGGFAGSSLGTLHSVDLVLPGTFPAGFSGTDFFVLTLTDAFGAVAETDETNNSGRMLIWDHDDSLITGPPPLLAAGGEAAILSSQLLTTADVDPLLDDALAVWVAIGISDSQVATLKGLQVGIVDLSGARLGEQFGNTVLLDVNVAGPFLLNRELNSNYDR